MCADAQRGVELTVPAVSGRDGGDGGDRKQHDEEDSTSNHFAGCRTIRTGSRVQSGCLRLSQYAPVPYSAVGTVFISSRPAEPLPIGPDGSRISVPFRDSRYQRWCEWNGASAEWRTITKAAIDPPFSSRGDAFCNRPVRPLLALEAVFDNLAVQRAAADLED